MFCTNCGSPVPDGAAFCTNCGVPLNAPANDPAETVIFDPEPAPMPEPEPVPVPVSVPEPEPIPAPIPEPEPEPVPEPAPVVVPNPAPVAPAPDPGHYGVNYTGAPAPASGAAVTFLRKVGGSPLMLIATLLLTVWTVCSIVSAATLLASFFGALDDFAWAMRSLGMGDLVRTVESIFSSLDPILIPLLVFALLECGVFPALWSLGMWLFFGNARGARRTGLLSTGGMTVIKVTEVFALVFECVICFGLSFLLVYFPFIQLPDSWAGATLGDLLPDMFQVWGIVFASIVLTMLILLLIYRIKVIRRVSSGTVYYDRVPLRPSSFLAVMDIIFAVLVIALPFLFTGFLALVYGTPIALGDTLDFLNAFGLNIGVFHIITFFAFALIRLLFAIMNFAARGAWNKQIYRI